MSSYNKYYLIGTPVGSGRKQPEQILEANNIRELLIGAMDRYPNFGNLHIIQGKVLIGPEYFADMNRTFQKAKRREFTRELCQLLKQVTT